MEAHIDRPLTIAAIARRVGVSTRALESLFLKIVDASPGAYFVALRPQRGETSRARHQSLYRRSCRTKRLLRHCFPLARFQAAVRRAAVRSAPRETLEADRRLESSPGLPSIVVTPSSHFRQRGRVRFDPGAHRGVRLHALIRGCRSSGDFLGRSRM